MYHLNKSKELTNSNFVVSVMSGNFTQRGETSITNKWEKTKLALENGIDLVIELPTIYSISSSENFSNGAVKILNSLGIIDYLSFGSETDKIESLEKISNLLYQEPEDFKISLKNELKLGFPYPKALENSIKKHLGETYKNLLTPNNTLGIEYLKSLKKLNSKITPILIKRIENTYNDTTIQNISSATAIRNQIKLNNISSIKTALPQNSYKEIKKLYNSGNLVKSISCFEKEIICKLRTMKKNEIALLPDVSEGLEKKIKLAVNKSNSLETLIENIKSKRYTRARIQRILLYTLLGITKQDMEISKNITPYVRILGFNEKGKQLISSIKQKNPDINLITSIKKFENTCQDENLLRLLEIDKLSTDIYSLAQKENYIAGLDYTTKIIEI